MKKTLLLLAVILAGITASAEEYTITTSGLTYTPAALNAQVGDIVHFEITSMHPTVQVSLATFLANGTEELVGGFGLHTENFSITLTEADVPGISYVCTNHVAQGMKGGIIVASTVAIAEVHPDIEFTYGPNPILNNTLTYTSNQEITQFEIFSLTGQIVKTVNIQSREGKVELNLTQGIYLMNILDEKGNSYGVRKLSVK